MIKMKEIANLMSPPLLSTGLISLHSGLSLCSSGFEPMLCYYLIAVKKYCRFVAGFSNAPNYFRHRCAREPIKHPLQHCMFFHGRRSVIFVIISTIITIITNIILLLLALRFPPRRPLHKTQAGVLCTPASTGH